MATETNSNVMSEKIRMVLAKKNKSKAWLAKEIGISSANLYNKLERNNFTEGDLVKIATALDCTLEANFVLNDTGEKI